jgi:Flp pilus assembly pilin Flp
MRKFFRSEDGQGMVEYTLIIAFVALAVILALAAMGLNLRSFFSSASEKLHP